MSEPRKGLGRGLSALLGEAPRPAAGPEASGRRVEFDPLTGRRVSAPAPHPVGTTVEVHGLFRGVPARRKFLRSERTEYLHLMDMVRRLALSPLAGSLRFRHEGNAALQAEGDAEDRIRSVLGAAFWRATLPLDCTAGSLRVHGRIGRPDQIKGTALFLASAASDFINGHILVVDDGYLAR